MRIQGSLGITKPLLAKVNLWRRLCWSHDVSCTDWAALLYKFLHRWRWMSWELVYCWCLRMLWNVNLNQFNFRYSEIPDTWDPPQAQPYQDPGDLHHYLLDPDAYDQYTLVSNHGHGNDMHNKIQIWQNTVPEPTLLEDRNVSTTTIVFNLLKQILNLLRVIGNLYKAWYILIEAHDRNSMDSLCSLPNFYCYLLQAINFLFLKTD